MALCFTVLFFSSNFKTSGPCWISGERSRRVKGIRRSKVSEKSRGQGLMVVPPTGFFSQQDGAFIRASPLHHRRPYAGCYPAGSPQTYNWEQLIRVQVRVFMCNIPFSSNTLRPNILHCTQYTATLLPPIIHFSLCYYYACKRNVAALFTYHEALCKIPTLIEGSHWNITL